MRDSLVERRLGSHEHPTRPVARRTGVGSFSSGGGPSWLGCTAVDETSTALSGATSSASRARAIPSTYVARYASSVRGRAVSATTTKRGRTPTRSGASRVRSTNGR